MMIQSGPNGYRHPPANQLFRCASISWFQVVSQWVIDVFAASASTGLLELFMKSFQLKNFQLTFSVVVSWKKRAGSTMAHICRRSDGQALKDVLLPARRKMPAVFSTSTFSSSGATCTGKGKYATQQAQLLQDSVPKVWVPNYNWCISRRPNQRIASAYVHHLYNFK